MKLLKIISFGRRAAAGLLVMGVVAGARGANNTNAPATGKAATGTNSAPTELTVPKSVFDLTANPTKDPFFPLSMRQPVPTATNTMAFSALSFTLKGLSGSPGHRLALINNRTLADGETTEISTASGKVKIHCIQIKDSSVIIRASTQTDPIEIFLRKAAQ